MNKLFLLISTIAIFGISNLMALCQIEWVKWIFIAKIITFEVL
jgi:hypothetical protein